MTDELSQKKKKSKKRQTLNSEQVSSDITNEVAGLVVSTKKKRNSGKYDKSSEVVTETKVPLEGTSNGEKLVELPTKKGKKRKTRDIGECGTTSDANTESQGDPESFSESVVSADVPAKKPKKGNRDIGEAGEPSEVPAEYEAPHTSTIVEVDFSGSEYASDDTFRSIMKEGVSVALGEELMQLFAQNVSAIDDWTPAAYQILNTLSQEYRTYFFEQLKDSMLTFVRNRPEYLLMLLQALKEKTVKIRGGSRSFTQQYVLSTRLTIGPRAEAMTNLMRSGYSLEVTPTLRTYGGPPPNSTETKAPTGCEIVVKGIPELTFEDVLVPLLEKCGRLWDCRLVMDSSTGKNRGFAFVTYCERKQALEAVDKLDGYFMNPESELAVRLSEVRSRIYIGRIDKTLSKKEILEVLNKEVDGITDVVVQRALDAPVEHLNGGFCFVDFKDQLAASKAKWKFENKYRPFHKDVIIDWDSKPEADEETMKLVKELLVENVPDEVAVDRLEEIFGHFGEVVRVVKKRDGAHVLFKKREACMEALSEWNGKELDGKTLQCSLAIPEDAALITSKEMQVSNLCDTVGEFLLQKTFEPFGELMTIRLMGVKAFIKFRERKACLAAIEAWNGKELNGRELECFLAKPDIDMHTKKRKKDKDWKSGSRDDSREGRGRGGRGSARGGGGGRGRGGGGSGGQRGGGQKKKEKRPVFTGSNTMPLGIRRGGSAG